MPNTYPPIIKSKNLYLLLAMLSYFICAPFIVDHQTNNLLISVLMSLIVLICFNSVSHTSFTFWTSLVLLCIAGTGFLAILILGPSRETYLFHFGVNTIFLIFMTLCIIISVERHRVITIDTLLGAINGYLLIGLTWACLYLCIACINPDAFTFHLSLTTPLRDNVQHFLYYSFTTLTTLGFGDITPVTNSARTLSWMEAACGQFYLAVWISQLVAVRIAQRIQKHLI